jgi:hypothetical protein
VALTLSVPDATMGAMKGQRTVNHRHIDIDGIRVFYLKAGPADAPVVLLPHATRRRPSSSGN